MWLFHPSRAENYTSVSYVWAARGALVPKSEAAGVHSASDTEHNLTYRSTRHGEEPNKPNSDCSRASSLLQRAVK